MRSAFLLFSAADSRRALVVFRNSVIISSPIYPIRGKSPSQPKLLTQGRRVRSQPMMLLSISFCEFCFVLFRPEFNGACEPLTRALFRLCFGLCAPSDPILANVIDGCPMCSVLGGGGTRLEGHSSCRALFSSSSSTHRLELAGLSVRGGRIKQTENRSTFQDFLFESILTG